MHIILYEALKCVGEIVPCIIDTPVKVYTCMYVCMEGRLQSQLKGKGIPQAAKYGELYLISFERHAALSNPIFMTSLSLPVLIS